MTSRASSQQTARRAIEILTARNEGFYEPTKAERQALLVAFASRGQVLYGQAFDVIRSEVPLEFTQPDRLAEQLDAITIYEIKSTNRPAMAADFRGYFFALTTAELLVAQNLGTQFKFAFVNTVTGDHLELALSELFARARGIYPTWSIRF